MAMVKRLERMSKHFNDVKVTENTAEGGDADEVRFVTNYFSLSELETIQKHLKIRRMKVPSGSPAVARHLLDGKCIIWEEVTCPTCGNTEWKNVTQELGAKLLGGNVPGW